MRIEKFQFYNPNVILQWRSVRGSSLLDPLIKNKAPSNCGSIILASAVRATCNHENDDEDDERTTTLMSLWLWKWMWMWMWMCAGGRVDGWWLMVVGIWWKVAARRTQTAIIHTHRHTLAASTHIVACHRPRPGMPRPPMTEIADCGLWLHFAA